MLEAVLFDLDGTIIDSELVAFKAILDCYNKWGVKIDHSDAASVAGKKWEIAFQHLFQQYELPCSREEASSAILKRYKERMQKEIAVVPGVLEAIRFFAEGEKLKLALVSGSMREDILWALSTLGIQKHFHTILGAEDYPKSKPAPDGYQKAMQLLKTEANSCLIFEDSMAGIASGHAAGAKVVAITSTNHFQQNLSAADYQMKDFSAVDRAWLGQLKQKFFN